MAKQFPNEFTVIFNEVCKDDYYGLRSTPFVPDVLFDLGANVGAFTTFARFMFPEALIVAVEPDPRNYRYLRQYTSHLPRIVYVNKAIGTGDIWQGLPPLEPPYYGAIRSYVTLDQIGFPESKIQQPPGIPGCDGLPVYERSTTEAISLHCLFQEHVRQGDKFLLKMDCEGGENCIYDDPASMAAMREADLITMETHYYTKGTGTEYEADIKIVDDSLMSLSDTHDCHLDKEKRYFSALRRSTHV